jgi:hypothetical protein
MYSLTFRAAVDVFLWRAASYLSHVDGMLKLPTTIRCIYFHDYLYYGE